MWSTTQPTGNAGSGLKFVPFAVVVLPRTRLGQPAEIPKLPLFRDVLLSTVLLIPAEIPLLLFRPTTLPLTVLPSAVTIPFMF